MFAVCLSPCLHLRYLTRRRLFTFAVFNNIGDETGHFATIDVAVRYVSTGHVHLSHLTRFHGLVSSVDHVNSTVIDRRSCQGRNIRSTWVT